MSSINAASTPSLQASNQEQAPIKPPNSAHTSKKPSQTTHKKSISIHFADFGDMQGIANKICALLSRHVLITLDSKHPQYVFYSVFGTSHIHYPCIRIFITGENLSPNFNICDYAIGFDHISFMDRYMRYPLYLFYEEDVRRAANKHKDISKGILLKKRRFCSFVVSNGNADIYREQVFHALHRYKHVDSGGRYLNNIGGCVKDKHAFLQEARFALCFENSSSPGYLTEKLIQAASAQSIPIYWGDTMATKPIDEIMPNNINSYNPFIYGGGGGINPKSFINAHDFASIDSLIEHIKTIDNDEAAQLAILREPLFMDDNHIAYFEGRLEAFLLHIVSQPYEEGFRRGCSCLRAFEEARYRRYMRILGICKKAKALIKAMWHKLT